jgi:outer membrane lipoprotein carrier protein
MPDLFFNLNLCRRQSGAADSRLPVIRFMLLLALFLALPPLAPASTNTSTLPEMEQQVNSLQKLYRGLVSLSFDFNQTTISSGRSRSGAGNAVFYRPGSGQLGIMRWNYNKPDPQIILNDGKKLFIYSQKDKQVIITSAEALQADITYAFFAGTSDLLTDFKPVAADNRFIFNSGDTSVRALQLVPRKPHGQIKSLHLWFDSGFIIQKVIMEDHFDTLTELTFSEIKINSLPVDSAETVTDLVKLDLPEDTEVINQ